MDNTRNSHTTREVIFSLFDVLLLCVSFDYFSSTGHDCILLLRYKTTGAAVETYIKPLVESNMKKEV